VKAEKRAGDIPSALYDATEALRLAGSLQASTSCQTSHAQGLLAGPDVQEGPWQVNALYLVCLAQVGQLWEMLGSPADALCAFREGHALVRLPSLS